MSFGRKEEWRKIVLHQGAEIERLQETDRLREAAFQCYVDEQQKDRAEIERLREALRQIIKYPQSHSWDIARAALGNDQQSRGNK